MKQSLILSLFFIAIAGFAAVLITRNIRIEAESRLKVEEGIAGAINRQKLELKQALEDYEKWEKQAAEDQMRKEFLGF